MKVAMVSCQQMVSGIGRYSWELLHHIQKIIPDTVLHAPSKKGELISDYINPYKHRSFRNIRPYILPYYIRRAIDPKEAEVFHAHWFMSGLALTYNMNKPSIVTMHDVSLLHIPESKDNVYRQYYAWAIERFKKKNIPLIVVSESAKNDTIRYAKYPEKLVHTVYNGINLNQFFPLNNKDSQKFRIIYSGGLGIRKRVDLLLEAFKLIEKKYDDVELHLAGAYPERSPYPAIANSLGLKNVYFAGYVPEEKMNEFYNSGDVLVYPSFYEGFGFAPLEAMAAGIPVISSTGGSLAEIAGGATLPIELNSRDIAEKVIYLRENLTLGVELKRKGLERVKDFTWEVAAQRTAKIYYDIK